MLMQMLSHFSLKNGFILAFYILLAFNLLMMLRQRYIVYFLGYKVLFLIYVGWWLVAQNLDIAALILWIVYGSFIVVVFIFSFLWLDTQHPTRLYRLTPTVQGPLTGITIMLVIVLSTADQIHNYSTIFYVMWLNHYELLHLQNSEEIESLGWALSTEHVTLILLASALLSVACLAAVILIITAKKHKWVQLRRAFKKLAVNSHILSAGVRKQILHQQESRELLKLNKIYKHLHRRKF